MKGTCCININASIILLKHKFMVKAKMQKMDTCNSSDFPDFFARNPHKIENRRNRGKSKLLSGIPENQVVIGFVSMYRVYITIFNLSSVSVSLEHTVGTVESGRINFSP